MPRTWQKDPPDNYQRLVLKAIPSEILGLYLAIHSLLYAVKPGAALMWVMLALCTAVTPLFLWKGGMKGPTQYITATIALPVWAMSIPGTAWSTIDGWQPWIGALAVILYAALIAPMVGFLVTKIAPSSETSEA